MDSIDSIVLTEDLMDLLPHLNKLFFHNTENAEIHLLPPTHVRVLVTLMKYGTMNVTHIAEHMEIQRQQLTKIIDALAEKNLICRAESSQNRRLILIHITKEGEAFIRKFIQGKAEIFAAFFNTLSEEDKNTLIRAIHILKTHAIEKKE